MRALQQSCAARSHVVARIAVCFERLAGDGLEKLDLPRAELRAIDADLALADALPQRGVPGLLIGGQVTAERCRRVAGHRVQLGHTDEAQYGANALDR